ncbi:MAG: hypothetical protein M1838_003917 [Thelocarpon superellum]|nr:MAG: hypothetical protein M1838_003917 [Thelocarpon superellum]
MAEATPSTPGSSADQGVARSSAPKDKKCPYCNQAFTSSSLGRHLDLYIKDKNPKPPDGVHDIEAIRKARGGITRRQARTSRGASSISAHASPEASMTSPSLRVLQLESFGGRGPAHYSEADWRSGRAAARDLETGSRPSGRREVSRGHPSRTSLDQRLKVREALDHGHAAELALQEVLGSIKAASTRAVRASTPLDFDPFACTFPGLVLQCLSPPPTLFSTEPFPALDSWSTDAPGQMQFEALTRHFRRFYEQWRSDRVGGETRPARTTSLRDIVEGLDQAESTSPTDVAQANEREEGKVLQHLADAFNHWSQLPEKQKQDAWRLELLRAYSREQGQRKETVTQLELARQEVENLKAQVDRLNHQQQPREFLLHPPTNLPISSETLRQIKGGPSAALTTWDYDRLLAKWKAVVHESRPSAGLAGQRSLGPTEASKEFLYNLGRSGGRSAEDPTSHPRDFEGGDDDDDTMETDDPVEPRRPSEPSEARRSVPREAPREASAPRPHEATPSRLEAGKSGSAGAGSGSRSVSYLWT